MAEATIRPAQPADIPALLPLLHTLFAIEPDFRFDAGKAEAALRALIGAPEAVVLVAETKAGICGMASMQTLISTAEGKAVGLVEDVVLAPEARGQGTGRRLVTTLLDIAKARGYPRVQLLVDKENGDAKAFYARLGGAPTRMECIRFAP